MDFFEDVPIHPTSIKSYNAKLNEWLSYMPKYFQSITNIIAFPELAMQVLNTHLKINTNTNKHVFIVAAMSFIRHHFDELSEHLTSDRVTELRTRWIAINNENEAPIIQRRLENKPTDLQAKKGGSCITFHQITEKRDELPIGSMERLLISMYTMIPPVRADYFATQIVRGDTDAEEKNYVRVRADGTMQCVLTDFKTAKMFGQIVNEFPSELVDEVRTSLELVPRNYLFLNANGKTFSRNSFTVWTRRILSKVFETDFTLVFFRHAYATHYAMFNDVRNMTDAQIKAISDKMGHSSEMFRAYRWIQSGGVGDVPENGSDDEKE